MWTSSGKQANKQLEKQFDNLKIYDWLKFIGFFFFFFFSFPFSFVCLAYTRTTCVRSGKHFPIAAKSESQG